jgi:leader peptidase (prepilin peptidase)/N-methyltransferase
VNTLPTTVAESEAVVHPGWVASFLPRRDPAYLIVTSLVTAAVLTVLAAAWREVSLLPAFAGLSVLGSFIAVGDLVTRRIPNRANVAALASAPPLLAVAALAGPVGAGSLVRAGLGALVAFALYFALWLAAPSGMGMGDVKFSPYVGAYLTFFGWGVLGRGLVYGFLIQGLIVMAALATCRLQPRGHIAHGPAMWLGVVVALLMAAPRFS